MIETINIKWELLYMIIIVRRAKVTEEAIKFAKECLGKEGYSILFGNCETFANKCRYGNPISFQVNINSKTLLMNIFLKCLLKH